MPPQLLSAVVYRPKNVTLATAVGSHISMLIKKPVERSYRQLLKEDTLLLMMSGIIVAACGVGP